MVLLDTTVVNVALGDIARDLHAGPTALEWVANGYTLVFAGLLLTTGLAADRVGARSVFLAGLATFAAGSVAATLAPSVSALVAAQAILGVGAALVLPTSLSLLSQVFTEPSGGCSTNVTSLCQRLARAPRGGYWMSCTIGLCSGPGMVG